jgi:catechol 2,3-dioxygenase-like lactoylglutathione lyase family enzyme
MFKIDFLDHVAIRVSDLEKSAEWYENTLGLKKYKLKEWGSYPIFMMAGKSGIALFPAQTNHLVVDPSSQNIKIDHFAFNVSNQNFELAKKRYTELQLEFTIQDHHYFHSIYIKDPDGHTVELTTLVVPEDEFY